MSANLSKGETLVVEYKEKIREYEIKVKQLEEKCGSESTAQKAFHNKSKRNEHKFVMDQCSPNQNSDKIESSISGQ